MPNFDYSIPKKVKYIEKFIELRSVSPTGRWYIEK